MMEALKLDLEIPFWCSFGDFSTLNLKMSYPFPPLTTLFGLIQNSMGKLAVHSLNNSKLEKKLKKEYVKEFNNLEFAVIIKDQGILVEDYVNIHKGSREKEKTEENLKKVLENFIKNSDYEDEIKSYISDLKKYSFYKYLNDEQNNDFDEIFYKVNNLNSNILDEIKNFWISESAGIKNYNINKIWLSTQINRQRLISPYFSIYISSDDNNEFSLESIEKHLSNPERPLYIGESDDVVNILNMSIVDIKRTSSSKISSVLPGLYSNCELVKVPTNLKFDEDNEYLTLCSIPQGELDTVVECYEYDGENFVFL